MKVKYFDSINILLPKDKIYSRLGYAKEKTKLTKNQEINIEAGIQKALETIDLKGAALRLKVKSVSSQQTILSEKVTLNSESVAKLLVNADEVLFMAATCGQAIIKLIIDSTKRGDLTSAIIFDAAASEVVDSALGWIMNYYSSQLKREDRHLTSRRFSAGYGDFGLENQKAIHTLLSLDKLGVSSSRKYILSPAKTVTALAGVINT